MVGTVLAAIIHHLYTAIMENNISPNFRPIDIKNALDYYCRSYNTIVDRYLAWRKNRFDLFFSGTHLYV